MIQLMRESRQLMKRKRVRFFYLQISFFGLILLSLLTCYIGMLWLIPYMQMTSVLFYRTRAAGNLNFLQHTFSTKTKYPSSYALRQYIIPARFLLLSHYISMCFSVSSGCQQRIYGTRIACMCPRPDRRGMIGKYQKTVIFLPDASSPFTTDGLPPLSRFSIAFIFRSILPSVSHFIRLLREYMQNHIPALQVRPPPPALSLIIRIQTAVCALYIQYLLFLRLRQSPLSKSTAENHNAFL